MNGIFSDVGALDYFQTGCGLVIIDLKNVRDSPYGSRWLFPQTFQYSYLGKLNPTYIMAYQRIWKGPKV